MPFKTSLMNAESVPTGRLSSELRVSTLPTLPSSISMRDELGVRITRSTTERCRTTLSLLRTNATLECGELAMVFALADCLVWKATGLPVTTPMDLFVSENSAFSDAE